MKRYDKRLNEFEEFLADTSNDSKEETLRSLRLQGVDTVSFLKQIQQTVEESYSKQLRAIAEREKEAKKVPLFLTKLADMPREAMLAVFGKLRKGEFGNSYQEAALARCRNKDAEELSDEELRSWLEDIGEIHGGPQE